MEEKYNQSALAIKYFLDNLPIDVIIGNKKPSNKDQELALFYLNHLTEVFSVFDRLIRYETYFKYFFPADKSQISEAEAIEYHLRSYIQDFYILQERIRKIVNDLIGDLPYYRVQNKEDVEKALRHLSDNNHKNLKKITSNLRRTHVHERSVSDPNLVTGKFLNLLSNGKILIPDDVKIDLREVKNKYENIIPFEKNKYISQAVKNNIALKKAKEWFAARFIYIFASLNGHCIKNLDMDIAD